MVSIVLGDSLSSSSARTGKRRYRPGRSSTSRTSPRNAGVPRWYPGRCKRHHRDPGTLTESYLEVSAALAKGRRILVINRAEIQSFFHTDHIVELLKMKMLELAMLSTLR